MAETTQASLTKNMRGGLVATLFILFSIIIFGLVWLFFFAPKDLGSFGWYFFSFAAGLSMIVLPCTLPLAFVIVPLSMGKGVAKGIGIAVSFGLGVALMLSVYGVAAAIIGKFAVASLGAPLEVVKNWVYFVAGIFALLFALGEIGLIKFRMPSYTGAAPAFIQKKQDYLKAFLLGMFLGNIGVGCPHPATPLILVEIATKGKIFYGWSLFFIHAIGRVLPLLFLALLGILGVNGLSWVVARKEKVEKATGWAMVFVAGFILTLGLFTHDWWVNSGIHTQFEKLTGEQTFLHLINKNLGTNTIHEHGLEVGTGLFGLPLWLGNWFLVFLWVVPLWWYWSRERRRIKAIPEANQVTEKNEEMKVSGSQRKFYVALSLLLALVFIYILPHKFMEEASMPHGHDEVEVTNNNTAVPAHTHEDDMNMEAMMATSSAGMPAMNHTSTTLYQEEKDVTEGLLVNLVFLNGKGNIKAGTTTPMDFRVKLLPQELPVEDLQIDHEKYIHVLGVREDLTGFFHIHPEHVSVGTWRANQVFKEPGNYKIWSDIKYNDKPYVFIHPMINVLGDNGLPGTTTTPNIEIQKNIILGNAIQVGIEYPEPIVMGRETPVHFAIKDLLGHAVPLENYLGVTMHLAIVKSDLSQYIHTHPSDHAHTNTIDESLPHTHSSFMFKTVYAHGEGEEEPTGATHVAFSVNFPEAGTYKLFAQFRPEGINLPEDQSLVGEFFVNVAADGPVYNFVSSDEITAPEAPLSKSSVKSVLVIISLVLIAVLGLIVKKFIEVKK